MNKKWLLDNAGYPIQYHLTQDIVLSDALLENGEVQLWLSKLSDRVLAGDLSNIHGSHDYRYENIIGKCFILGLDSKIPKFDFLIGFFIGFLNTHIKKTYDEKLTFGKIYQYRDYETILTCYLPFLGYADEPCVRYIANKRINIIYEFTKQERYNIYKSDNPYPGAKKEWKPYIIDPVLYADGNIAVPSIHDFILFAGMYLYLSDAEKNKIETTVKWIFNDQYAMINNSYYYYAPDDPSYKSKSINNKIALFDFNQPPAGQSLQELLYLCFILSHFKEARKSRWFHDAILYFTKYKNSSGRYVFPREMITEQKDTSVVSGGHMNVGESKKNRQYSEIISTYWMEKILCNHPF